MAKKQKRVLTAAEMGKRGGTARARNMSKERLSEIGRQGAEARREKAKQAAQ